MKLPPHSEAAEAAVLGCLLLSPQESINDILGKIVSESFYDLRHRSIFDCILELNMAGKTVDIITVQNLLKEKELLNSVGGIMYLSELQDAVPSAANLPAYAEEVIDHAIRRKLIQKCVEIENRAFNEKAETVLDDAERDILAIRPNESKEQGLKEQIDGAMERLQKIFEQNGEIGGMTTGLVDLDRSTDGMNDGEMIVIAAYPGGGKTALALNICVNNALRGVPVGVLSFEMTAESLLMRAICSEARLNKFDLRDQKASEQDFARLASARATLLKSPLHIRQCSGISIAEVIAIARRMKQKHGIKLLMVDYIQLVSNPSEKSRELEISSISKGLKKIAMELNIPILALSQLNDDGKLRESRAIGQDADSVWILSMEGDEVLPKDQPVKCYLHKTRNGTPGLSVPLMFRKQYVRFENQIHAAKDLD